MLVVALVRLHDQLGCPTLAWPAVGPPASRSPTHSNLDLACSAPSLPAQSTRPVPMGGLLTQAMWHTLTPAWQASSMGNVAPDWLRSCGFAMCVVCQRASSLRCDVRCLSCFTWWSPALLLRPLAGLWSREPSMSVMSSLVNEESGVPSSAKDCEAGLCRVLGWHYLGHLSLPCQVLCWLPRLPHRQENDTKRRCRDWISGLLAELWTHPFRASGRSVRDSPAVDTHDALPDAVVARVCTFIRRAFAALFQEPPVTSTDDVVTELRSLYPAPSCC